MLTLLSNALVYTPALSAYRHLLLAGEKIIRLREQAPELGPALAVTGHDLGGRRRRNRL